MFFCRGKDKWYLYRAIDEHGQVVDVLLREHRDTASAEAFFEQALGRSGQVPSAIIAAGARSVTGPLRLEDYERSPELTESEFHVIKRLAAALERNALYGRWCRCLFFRTRVRRPPPPSTLV